MNLKRLHRIADMATVKVFRDLNRRITVNPDLNQKGDEYFKYYNSATYSNDEKVARILFRSPKYVTHNQGLDSWTLSGKDKRELVTILSQEVNTDGHLITVWQRALVLFNLERWNMEIEDTILNVKDSKGNYPFPDALPFDLQMPDYLQLK